MQVAFLDVISIKHGINTINNLGGIKRCAECALSLHSSVHGAACEECNWLVTFQVQA